MIETAASGNCETRIAMKVVGRLESVWRYPVKSMSGETLPEAYVSFAGVLGDRLYAVHHLEIPPDRRVGEPKGDGGLDRGDQRRG